MPKDVIKNPLWVQNRQLWEKLKIPNLSEIYPHSRPIGNYKLNIVHLSCLSVVAKCPLTKILPAAAFTGICIMSMFVILNIHIVFQSNYTQIFMIILWSKFQIHHLRITEPLSSRVLSLKDEGIMILWNLRTMQPLTQQHIPETTYLHF